MLVPVAGSAAGAPAPPPAHRSGLQRLEAVEDLAVGIHRPAQVADPALDLALALGVARLAGVDVELQLPAKRR
jgi:hypothetical protein